MPAGKAMRARKRNPQDVTQYSLRGLRRKLSEVVAAIVLVGASIDELKRRVSTLEERERERDLGKQPAGEVAAGRKRR